ncbi:hypothetical protein C6B38_00460, partial [Spiroplasma sp. ChiS]
MPTWLTTIFSVVIVLAIFLYFVVIVLAIFLYFGLSIYQKIKQ